MSYISLSEIYLFQYLQLTIVSLICVSTKCYLTGLEKSYYFGSRCIYDACNKYFHVHTWHCLFLSNSTPHIYFLETQRLTVGWVLHIFTLIFVCQILIIHILNKYQRLSRFSSEKPLCSVMKFKIRSLSSSSHVQGQYSAINKRSTFHFFGCLFFFACLAFNNIWFHRTLLILRNDIFR